MSAAAITAAIGHRRIGDFEQCLQKRALTAAHGHKRSPQEDQGVQRPLQPPAHVQEAPGLAAGHALHGQATKCRQAQDQLVKQRQDFAQRYPIDTAALIARI